ncbi:MAG: DnaJ domain-containing protein [Spirochaetaceae bacterium]|jgi:curved DNA-binding protein CbpA|nr:DnaJ domain-containing protein [Spirochaetaceae bacterium]
MQDYYSLLGINHNASQADIKKAFREKAKRLHPDIAGSGAADAMRKLLSAYEVLSNEGRRGEYDRAYNRFVRGESFDYRRYLAEDPDDPGRQAKLVFFDLLHLEEDSALSIWRRHGGLGFAMEKYLDREDWLDCSFILSEELSKRGDYYEAFILLTDIIREERRKPYFRHYTEEIENTLKELARLRLKAAVDSETFIDCMEILLELGFPPRDEARWMRSMSEALIRLGEIKDAEAVFREALRRDPALPNVTQLRRKLNVG